MLCGDVQMQVVSLLQLTGAGAEARHLQSVTQQLSQATSEIQSLTNQLQSSQSEVVSCYAVMHSSSMLLSNRVSECVGFNNVPLDT